MTQTPDAAPGDVEAGANSGHAADGSSDPQNPIGAFAGDVAQDEATAPEQVVEAIDVDEAGSAARPAPADAAEQPAHAAQEPANAAEEPANAAQEPVNAAEEPGAVAPQAPAAPSAADPAGELRTELARELAASQRRGDELATVARKQTEMADELHAENRRLRTGEIREAVAPLVRGLARLADDLSLMGATADEAPKDLVHLARQVEDLLHDAGVFALRPEIGEPFDPHFHRATGKAKTDDSALQGTIARVSRSGLRRDDGRLLRPVDVVVFRYEAPSPAAQQATEEVL
jgi:molecular chaperone GrpE (heat shock protein)